jgi:hypothetical protein
MFIAIQETHPGIMARLLFSVVAALVAADDHVSLLQTSAVTHHHHSGKAECKAARAEMKIARDAVKAARVALKTAKGVLTLKKGAVAEACPKKEKVKEGMCSGQPEGAACSLGELSDSLVENPSFEEYTSCPTKDSQVNLADGWHNPTSATPDYWVTSCPAPRNNKLAINLPDAFDGDAFIGLAKIDNSFTEYCGRCLKTPIIKGKKYTFSFAMAVAALTGPGGAKWGGDNNGKTDLLCIPECDAFPISGRDYKAGSYHILAKAQPGSTVKPDAGWSQVTFAFTADQDCPGIMFGASQDGGTAPFGSGQIGSYALYDQLGLHEGSGGQCTADGQCIG